VVQRGYRSGDVLVALGEGAGLDGAALRQALGTLEFEAEVTADEELAERLGVRAVPVYEAARRRVLTGVRTLEELRMLVFGQRKNKRSNDSRATR